MTKQQDNILSKQTLFSFWHSETIPMVMLILLIMGIVLISMYLFFNHNDTEMVNLGRIATPQTDFSLPKEDLDNLLGATHNGNQILCDIDNNKCLYLVNKMEIPE